MAEVFFEITLPIKIKQEEGIYISSVPVLDICSQGDTKSEAKHNIIEAVKLFFISCLERGTLDAALRECGLQVTKTRATIPIDHDFIKVPIPFSVTGSCPTECRV
jgi:predicted RNase H-like HicB family nuclease